MIRSISIREYRSCLDTSFELHPKLSVLIGPNSSGKTNVMNALLLLRRLVEEQPYFYHDEEPTGHCKLRASFNIDDSNATLSAVVNTYTNESNKDVVLSSDQQWYMKDLTGNRKRIHFPLALARELSRAEEMRRLSIYQRRMGYALRKEFGVPPNIRNFIGQIALDLSEIRYYSVSQFTNPSNCPVSFELEKEGRSSRGISLRGHAKFLFDIYNSYKYPDKTSYQQFVDIIGPNGIGLVNSIEFKELPTSSIDYSVKSGGTVTKRTREKVLVVPQFRIGKNDLSPNQLSEGTFKTITLLFYLITETSKLLLIEEPEVCVHHGLLSSILELIKTYSRNKQIVISTHSDFVLDIVQPENVYKVTNLPEEGTKVSHIPKLLSRRELTALRSYLETEGNLGEYWRCGGLE